MTRPPPLPPPPRTIPNELVMDELVNIKLVHIYVNTYYEWTHYDVLDNIDAQRMNTVLACVLRTLPLDELSIIFNASLVSRTWFGAFARRRAAQVLLLSLHRLRMLDVSLDRATHIFNESLNCTQEEGEDDTLKLIILHHVSAFINARLCILSMTPNRDCTRNQLNEFIEESIVCMHLVVHTNRLNRELAQQRIQDPIDVQNNIPGAYYVWRDDVRNELISESTHHYEATIVDESRTPSYCTFLELAPTLDIDDLIDRSLNSEYGRQAFNTFVPILHSIAPEEIPIHAIDIIVGRRIRVEEAKRRMLAAYKRTTCAHRIIIGELEACISDM